MSYYALTALINFITSVSLGGLILFRNPKKTVNLTFLLFTFSVAFWSLSYFVWQMSKNADDALFWTRVLMAFAIFIPIFYFHFIIALLDIIKQKKRFLVFGYIIFSSFFALDLFTPYIVSHTEPILKFPYWPMPGNLFHPLLATWLGYVIYTNYILYKYYLTSSGLKKLQIKYLLLGMIVGYLGGITNYFLWYKIPIPPLGNILVSVYVGATAYAIIRHRLLDIRLVVARTIAYSLLVSIIAVFYTASTFLLSTYFLRTALNGNQLLVYTTLTLIVAFTFQPLRRFLEKATDKIFYKGHYDSHQLLSSLTNLMATTLLLDELTKKVLEKLLAEMRITRGAFVLLEKGSVSSIHSVGYKKNPEVTVKEAFMLQASNKTLVLEELEEGHLKELMRDIDITVATPLIIGQGDIGLLVLGEKASGDIYNEEDIKVLEIFAPEASVAIKNSLSYEEIKRFNITLKEKVERATQELRVANEKLKELDKLKDDFISITSHDLRTPMTAIKSYLWLVMHGKAGEIKNEKMKKYLDITYQSSERMITLINDLLNVSRIESGRIQLTLQPTPLEDIIAMEIAELLPKAQENKTKLTFEKPKEKLPVVMLDRERFPEIITNLVGNAIKFTPHGEISVTVKKEVNFVEIAIKDTGPGISKGDLPKLFTKFGRLDNSYTAVSASGGTGLGLYITKNLVELHGGRVWVESKVGKGTTFSFTVKIATAEDIKKEGERPVETKPAGVIYAPPN